MKLPWPGFNEKKTVIIPLEKGAFDISGSPIIIQSRLFKPKDELHITLIGKKLGGSLQQEISRDPEIEKQLDLAFQDIDWSFEQTGPVHILSRTKEIKNNKVVGITVNQESIILILGMPGIAAFYDYLKTQNLIESDQQVPPPHVTLYTRNCPSGIGVSSSELLDNLSKKILSVIELKKLCRNH